MFEQIQSCLFDESFNFPEIFVAPFTAQARRVVEDGAAGFTCLRIDNIMFIAYPATG